MIYFLIVNYYSTQLVGKLVNSLPASNNPQYAIAIVNNSPEDDSIYQLQSSDVVILTPEENLGFGSGCNFGLKWIFEQNPSAFVWIINPDAYFLEDVLEQVKLFFQQHPKISILGTAIYTPLGDVWFAGGRFFPATGSIVESNLLINTNAAFVECDWVSGCSMIINLNNFGSCPFFDSAYFLYYEDFDFCRRYASLGHQVAVTKQFSVVHQPSSITNQNIFGKIKHSTYSYLLTLERYTSKKILVFRSIRLIFYAFILLFVKRDVAWGKFVGVFNYLRHPNKNKYLIKT